jgi:uncharacterized peroxidase-related enzyme
VSVKFADLETKNRKIKIMSRIKAINPANATGKAKQLLEAVQSKLGITPNLMRAMANSPAVLEGYLNFSGALAGGSLNAKVREQIALAVAEVNSCGYCLSAHTAIGKMVGLDSEAITLARRIAASDAKTDAILKLAQSITLQRGEISDADFRAARTAGLTDGEIAEVVANVALNIFTNYFNLVADTVIDFPEVKPGVEETSSRASAVTREEISMSSPHW